MLPESKIRTHKTKNLTDNILSTNLLSSYIYRPKAVSDYEKAKDEEKKKIHEEIKRVSMNDRGI